MPLQSAGVSVWVWNELTMTANQQQIETAVEGLDEIISTNLQPRLEKLRALSGQQTDPAIKYEVAESAGRLKRAIKDIRRCIEHADKAINWKDALSKQPIEGTK